MHLMYVDESGDCGMVNSPGRYFVLTGIVLHELRWEQCRQQLIEFRRRMRHSFSLKLREEIHASAMLSKPGDMRRIKLEDRISILRFFGDELASMQDLSAINIVVDKLGKAVNYPVFEMAWRALIQRFENTISHRNFNGPANADERGLILPDHTDDKKLVALLRKLRQYNPIPNQTQFGSGFRNLKLAKVVEDPFFRDSAHNYFIQASDLIAFFLYQKLAPNAKMKRRAGHKYFDRLHPILCKKASSSDPQGVVRI